MEQLLFESVKTAGPIVVLIIFFVWRDYKREDNMTSRIREVEDFVKTKLLDALNQTTETISRNTEVLDLTRDALSTVNGLPCVLNKDSNCKHYKEHIA